MNNKKLILFYLNKYKILIIASAVGIPFLTTLYINSLIREIPPVETLQSYSPALSTKIYDRNGTLIYELFTEKRRLTPLNEIPENLKKAVIATEDTNFYFHYGFSPRGIIRALINNTFFRKSRGIQGGSTLTQQLSKTIFLTKERTISRKIKELIMSIQLERNFSKDEILELYLNQIYFGNGAYGIDAASKIYFSKSPQELTLAEAALLAGLVKAPNYYSPFKNPEQAKKRRKTVLDRMLTVGFIYENDYKNALNETIPTEKPPIASNICPYFVEYVRLQLEPVFGEDMIYRGGLSVYTTLDADYQKAAEAALESNLSEIEKDPAFVSNLARQQKSSSTIQGAILATDVKTGGILAMVGGRDFKTSQFNRATQAMRQPGSSFKPIIYTAALESGFKATSILEDTPLVYLNDGRDWYLASKTTDFLLTLDHKTLSDPMKVWVPQNYKNKYHGLVSFRQALEQSMNSVSIRILETVTPPKAIDYARRMGITSPLINTLSLALGSSDVTLYEMVRAFGTLANYGIKTKPYAVIKVEDRDGRILLENLPEEEETLSAATCFVITHIMKGVLERGTAQNAKISGLEAAGKTGTTNDNTDAWFIGYTSSVVCGVWVGFDDKTRIGYGMTGGRVSAPIWRDFFQKIISAGKIELPTFFPVPKGVVLAGIDPTTGMLATGGESGSFVEAFLAGTEPKQTYQAQAPQTEEKPTPRISDIKTDTSEGF